MGEETTENYTTLYLFLFNDNFIKLIRAKYARCEGVNKK